MTFWARTETYVHFVRAHGAVVGVFPATCDSESPEHPLAIVDYGGYGPFVWPNRWPSATPEEYAPLLKRIVASTYYDDVVVVDRRLASYINRRRRDVWGRWKLRRWDVGITKAQRERSVVVPRMLFNWSCGMSEGIASWK